MADNNWEIKNYESVKTHLLVSSTTVASINSVDLSLTITWQSSPSASGDLINLPASKRQWARSGEREKERRKWKTINYMIGMWVNVWGGKECSIVCLLLLSTSLDFFFVQITSKQSFGRFFCGQNSIRLINDTTDWGNVNFTSIKLCLFVSF